MRGGDEMQARGRTMFYCLIPGELGPRLLEPLRRHFRDDPNVEVVVERRDGDRRAGQERRVSQESMGDRERRGIRGRGGRRIDERRGTVMAIDSPPLPRKAQRYAHRIVFVEVLAPDDQREEDRDTARLVTRIQAGQRDQFAVLYMRYFDRVYGYLRLLLNDPHEAEDIAQQVFAKLYEVLPGYERRAAPFRAWLFTIVHNHAVSHLRRQSRMELMDPVELGRRRAGVPSEDAELSVLSWLSDKDLLMFVERLPLAQRQVLLMRFMLDLSHDQIAATLGRTPNEVRKLQQRAVAFLRQRLTALGRAPAQRGSISWRRRKTQIRVLRDRRYALLGR